MYSHILIDMDDTLFDFQRAQDSCFRDVLRYYSEEYTTEKYNRYSAINHSLWRLAENQIMRREDVQCQRFIDFFAELNKTVNGEDANRVFQDSLAKQAWLIPEATDVCRILSKNHILAIITNGIADTQYQRLNTSAISCFFSEIIVSEAVGFEKPNVLFFKKAFDLLHFYDTSKMLVVGDSLTSDIRGARNVGIDSCWYNPNKQLPVADCQPTYIISELKELLTIVSE